MGESTPPCLTPFVYCYTTHLVAVTTGCDSVLARNTDLGNNHYFAYHSETYVTFMYSKCKWVAIPSTEWVANVALNLTQSRWNIRREFRNINSLYCFPDWEFMSLLHLVSGRGHLISDYILYHWMAFAWQCQYRNITLLGSPRLIAIHIHAIDGKWSGVCLIILSLWPSGSIWWYRSGSILAQVMAWCLMTTGHLIHWGRVTHICVSKLSILASDNGLSPGRRQAIIWTNAGILLIGPLGTNFSEILIAINTFSFKKMHFKMSSGKWRPFISASMC